MIRLFVYGTLMRGEPAHALIADSGRLIGEACTAPRHALLDLGPYPAMIEGDGVVHGELFAIDASRLPLLDDYEGHPSLYRRMTIALEEGEAAGYLLVDRALCAGAPRIASGDWRRR